jgi:TPR repeat protein
MEIIEKKKWEELLSLAQEGNSDAQWEVGYYHEEGAVDELQHLLVEKNSLQALYWHTLSAEQGNQSAQVSLSNLLSTGEDVERDYNAAIRWAKKAMSQGNASAAYNLGTIYRDLKKPAKAFRCYQQAVAMGDDDALLQVGLCYLFSHGTKQDLDTAYDCFQQIITRNSSASTQRTKENAYYWMAIFKLVGLGNTKKSVVNARKMLEIANADDDHEQANEILNVIGKTKYLQA